MARSPSPWIDPQTGVLRFGRWLIRPGAAEDELAGGFVSREEAAARGAGPGVVFRFNREPLTCSEGRFDACLRFDGGRLASVFLEIGDPAAPDTVEVSRCEALHAAWLQRQREAAGSMSGAWGWGALGVGRDKSDNVFIYLHART